MSTPPGRTLKILICSANYAPEPTGVGKYSGEMAQWLAAHGFQVRVIAAPQYYPEWRVAAVFRGRAFRREQRDGVEVWRAPLWVPARQGGWQRVLHLASFALSAAPLLLWWAVRWQPQVCITVAPFLTAAPAAWVAARLAGGHAWLHVQDFELDVAFRLGLLKGRRLQRLAAALEGGLYGRFDTVSSISRRMLDVAAAKGTTPGRLFYLPNWVDTRAISPLARSSRYRAELGIGPGEVVALFAGTLGRKHGLAVLPALAQRLAAAVPPIHLVLCGRGPLREELVQGTAGLPRVHFLDLQPQGRMDELLGLADIHLLLQDPAAQDFVLPSKLAGMLASGRPVLATCDEGSELAAVVARCGERVAPGDPGALAASLLTLAQQPQRRAQLGAAARAIACAEFDREPVLGRLAAALLERTDGAA